MKTIIHDRLLRMRVWRIDKCLVPDNETSDSWCCTPSRENHREGKE